MKMLGEGGERWSFNSFFFLFFFLFFFFLVFSYRDDGGFGCYHDHDCDYCLYPSRHPHLNPCTTLSRTVFSSALSTSDGSVSSTSTLAPQSSGPNAHIDRAASRSQSYLLWKNSPMVFLSHEIFTAPLSMSLANPLSRGSAVIVSLLRLFGVSEKHFIEELSTTVSQKATTGSATLSSMEL